MPVARRLVAGGGRKEEGSLLIESVWLLLQAAHKFSLKPLSMLGCLLTFVKVAEVYHRLSS